MIGGLTHVDSGGEGLRLGEHGEAVAEVGHVVGGHLLFHVLGLAVLVGNHGVVRVVGVGHGASIDGVKHLVQEAGIAAAGNGEAFGLDKLRTIETYGGVQNGGLVAQDFGEHLLLSFRIIILHYYPNTLNTFFTFTQ